MTTTNAPSRPADPELLPAILSPREPSLAETAHNLNHFDAQVRQHARSAVVAHPEFQRIVRQLVGWRLRRWGAPLDAKDVSWALISRWVTRGGLEWLGVLTASAPADLSDQLRRKLQNELRHLLVREFGPQFHRPQDQETVHHRTGLDLTSLLDHRQTPDSQDALLDEQQDLARMHVALAGLEPLTRLVVIRHFLQGQSLRQLAIDLGCSDHRVRQVLRSGLDALRRAFGR
jgi:RNA polymerase sigma factor (sigma-70 family)